LQERIRNADELDKLVGAWTINHSPEEVMALMQTAKVPAGVVKTGEDLAKDPQLMHYNAFQIVDHPEMGSCAAQRASIKLTKTIPCEPVHPPLLGEHTEYVRTQMLGIPDEEFIDLLNDGVFG
jgi:benzylsuccinate CoA-transferase BbsF subunit